MMELYSVRRRGPGLRHRATWKKAASRPRSAVTPRTSSPRSTPGRRPPSWSSTAGARAPSIRRPGKPFERKEGPSLWGHERAGCRKKDRDAAREKRMQLARDGVRQPVQVIEGNYESTPASARGGTASRRTRRARSSRSCGPLHLSPWPQSTTSPSRVADGRPHRIGDRRHAVGAIEHADPIAIAPADEPIAVVLDLVHPLRARRGRCGRVLAGSAR